MFKKKFVTVLNCMDGRFQLPTINFMKEKFSADYVDMITEAGIDKILASNDSQYIPSIKNKISISLNSLKSFYTPYIQSSLHLKSCVVTIVILI